MELRIGNRVGVRFCCGGLRLEIERFPSQAFTARRVGEEHLAGRGMAHVPFLGGWVEADVRGPEDGQSSERMEWDRFGIQAVDETTGLEAKGGVHPSPSCCWFRVDCDCRQKSGFRVRSRGLPSASSMALVAASQPLPLNPSASTEMSPMGEIRT